MMHLSPVNDAEQLLRVARDSHVIYPVIVDKQEAGDLDRNLIGLIPSSSSAFVVPRGKRESYPKKLLVSVFEAWPVLILTILLSLLAGVFLWLLVSETFVIEKMSKGLTCPHSRRPKGRLRTVFLLLENP